MKAGISSLLATAKRSAFSGGKMGPWGGVVPRFSLATLGVGMFIGNKSFKATHNVVKKGGNIDLYKGLYTQPGENIIASGKRGIDANVGGTAGLVQGLHSNRRRY